MASKDDIANAFERHVQRFGYQKATLDEVASELHISKKTIYRSFEGKADIYAYIVDRIATRERLRMSALVADLPTWSDKLADVLRYVLGMGRTHVAETSEEDWMQEYAIAVDAFTAATGNLVQEIVESGIAAGEFRSGDARLVERMVSAMGVEYVLMVRADPSYDRDDELVGRILRFVT